MKKVLIVEYDPVSHQLLRGHIEGRFKVSSAFTYASTLLMIETFQPDVILLDYILSDGEGLGILKFIREKEYKSRVIVITSFLDTDILAKCQAEGAFDFFQKPIGRDQLIECVETAINYPKSHAFRVSKSAAEASRKLMKKPFDFDSFMKALGGDADVAAKTLKLSIEELEGLVSSLTVAMSESSEQKKKEDLLFILHRFQSVTRSLFTPLLQRAVTNLYKAVQEGKGVPKLEVPKIEEECQRVITAIGEILRDKGWGT